MTPEEIRDFRKKREWSQQQLASELGVDQATVSRIENGDEPRAPIKKLLERIMAEPSGEATA